MKPANYESAYETEILSHLGSPPRPFPLHVPGRIELRCSRVLSNMHCGAREKCFLAAAITPLQHHDKAYRSS